MLIHERFVFLHLPKTAGTFVAAALTRELPPGSLSRGAPHKLHPTWDDMPPEAAELPVLAYVRNPWDWYVSWYHFVLGRRPDHVIFQQLFADGDADFATTVRKACVGALDGFDRQEVERASERHPLIGLLAQGHDFYTARVLASLGAGFHSDRLTLGRFESLAGDLERFLTGVGVGLPAGARERIAAAEPLKVTEHRPYRDYYDEALRDLVGKSCHMLIERFDYRF